MQNKKENIPLFFLKKDTQIPVPQINNLGLTCTTHKQNNVEYICCQVDCQNKFLCSKCINEEGPNKHKCETRTLQELFDMKINNENKYLQLIGYDKIGKFTHLLDNKKKLLQAYTQSCTLENKFITQKLETFKELMSEQIDNLKAKIKNNYIDKYEDINRKLHFFHYQYLHLDNIPPRHQKLDFKNSKEFEELVEDAVPFKYEVESNENSLIKKRKQKVLGYLRSDPVSPDALFFVDTYINHLKNFFNRTHSEEIEGFFTQKKLKLNEDNQNIYQTPAKKLNNEKEKLLSPEKEDEEYIEVNVFKHTFEAGEPKIKKNQNNQDQVPANDTSNYKSFATFKLFKTIHFSPKIKICIAISLDSENILLGSDKGTLELLNIESGCIVASFKGHKDRIRDLIIIKGSGSQDYIVSASHDKTMKIWDLISYESIGEFQGHKEAVWSVKELNTKQYIISGSADRSFKIWNFNTKQCLGTFFHARQHNIQNICLIPSNLVSSVIQEYKHVKMSADKTNQISVVCIASKTEILIWHIVINPKKEEVLVTLAKIFETGKGNLRYITILNQYNIISGDVDGILKIWSLKKGQVVKEIKAHHKMVSQILVRDISGDNIITVGHDDTVNFWNLQKMQCSQVLAYHIGFVQVIGYVKQGGFFTIGEDSTLRIYY